MARPLISRVPVQVSALVAAVDSCRIAGEWEVCRKTYPTLVESFPNNREDSWYWPFPSGAAVNANDLKDQALRARAMLARFGGEARDDGIIDRVLKTVFVVRSSWKVMSWDGHHRLSAPPL